MDDLERRLRVTNLNLLPILWAVLKYRNLTRAAEALNITQSGVSNSLKQLRDHFGDELLVREGRGLRLTEKGKQLIGPLEQALGAVGRVLANPAFDPATSVHGFRVATADYVTAITAPEMAALMSREAPGMAVQMITAQAHSAVDLRAGELDIIISPRQIIDALSYDAPGLTRDLIMEPLGSEPFVCLARDEERPSRPA